MSKRIEGWPDRLTIIGWRPLEFPLTEGSIIQVGVQLPSSDSTLWRPESFTVFTLPYVDELNSQLSTERQARADAEAMVKAERDHSAYVANLVLKNLDKIGCNLEWFALHPKVTDARLDRETIIFVMALLTGLSSRAASAKLEDKP